MRGWCYSHRHYVAGCLGCKTYAAQKKARQRNPGTSDTGTRRTYGPRYDALIAAAADAAVRPLGRMKLGGRTGRAA